MTGFLLAFAVSPILSSVLVGILCGLLAAGITVLTVVLLYRRKNRSASYPLDKFTSLNLTERNDVFTGKTVTRQVIRQASNDRDKK